MSSININFKNKDFSAVKAGNSTAMKKIMEFGSAKRALKSKSQQQAFYDTLKKNKNPNHMDKALKETLGEFLENKKDKTTDREVKAMGKEMVRYGKRFIVLGREMRTGASDKDRVGLITAKIMERRSQTLNNTSASLNQVQAPPARIPIIGNYGMRSKASGISPSFGATTRLGTGAGPIANNSTMKRR